MSEKTPEEKIESIDKILNAGVASVTTDGQTVNFQSPDELRKRKRDLNPRRRPVVSSVYLGGF